MASVSSGRRSVLNVRRVSITGGLLTALWLCAELGSVVQAGPLVIGNFMVSDLATPGRLREFTPAGVLVQTINLPAAPGDGDPRDFILDANGNFQIWNGTFNPYLTSFNPVTSTVLKDTTLAGFSTVNNCTYGGIGAFANYVFLSDMSTAGAGAPNGIVRFDINTYASTRFAAGTDYIDVSVGQDGLVYGLTGGNVDVYDPTTLALLRTAPLALAARAVAVDTNGDIFAVGWIDDKWYHHDKTGTLIKSVKSPLLAGYSDLDIDSAGRLVAAAGDKVVVSDRTLATFNVYTVGTTSACATFVAWATLPPGGIPPPVVPPVAPAPPGSEGSYAGSNGPNGGGGGEGTFGFGYRAACCQPPDDQVILLGPFAQGRGRARVLNVSRQLVLSKAVRIQPDGLRVPDDSPGLSGWELLAFSFLASVSIVLLASLYSRLRLSAHKALLER